MHSDSRSHLPLRLRAVRPAALRAAVFLLCLIPLLLLLVDAARGDLTANPIENLTHRTGWWALVLLLVTLSITPLRRLTGWNGIVKLRRMVGLFAFLYASLHVAIYFGLDQLLSFEYIAEDILERPYITVGFLAWVLLVPLAITSTRGWIRRLGSRWQRLHRLVYVSAALAILHFLWLVKADTREPLLFGAAFAALMLLRLPVFRRSPRRPAASSARGMVADNAVNGAAAVKAAKHAKYAKGKRKKTGEDARA